MQTCQHCGREITHCNHCGHRIDMEAQLDDDRLINTLKAVRRIQRNGGKGTASTKAVAARINYSTRWTLEWLGRLEELELIHRPRGPKSGWAAVQAVRLEVVQAA